MQTRSVGLSQMAICNRYEVVRYRGGRVNRLRVLRVGLIVPFWDELSSLCSAMGIVSFQRQSGFVKLATLMRRRNMWWVMSNPRIAAVKAIAAPNGSRV